MELLVNDSEWMRHFMVVANYLHNRRRHEQRRRQRRWWMRPMFFRREEDGNVLLQNILEEQMNDTIIKFLRMRMEDFYFLESLVLHRIQRMNTNMRHPVTARERLMITLRFLATGECYSSLQFLFRVSRQAIGKIVPDVCEALMEALQDYVKLPSTRQEWLDISKRFKQRWGFPHAIGAIDGKHIPIIVPNNAGNMYFNYKHFNSIVMLALVDADYKFLYVNVGGQVSISDGGIFRNTQLYRELENKALDIPEPEPITVPYLQKVPYFILGDKAFAFTDYCIRPYGGQNLRAIERHFNYRHSRARMPVEDTFGIFSNRFKIAKGPIYVPTDVAQKTIITAVYVHNFLRVRISRRTATTQDIHFNREGEMPLQSLIPITNRPSERLASIRNHIANHLFFNDISGNSL
ncbi:uncharacterized protein LOC125953363 [Anopheles darlingi]|uniref:uncharacterized protein LOC125953363 n=1 Tax=Anopheles darlingi TaxID=43151 RepID=UPI0021001228|nr:uncharacterized protein LOC125953363 [Anopheles darlingi]